MRETELFETQLTIASQNNWLFLHSNQIAYRESFDSDWDFKAHIMNHLI